MIPHLIPNVAARQELPWSHDFNASAASDEALSRPSDRVFLALQPPPAIAARAYRIGQNVRDMHGLRCSLIDAERLHLSLLGFRGHQALSPATIDAIFGAVATVVMPQFRLELNRMMRFGQKRDSEPDDRRNRPIVLIGDDLTTPGIVMLRQHIIDALRKAGCSGAIPSSFNPHMTLFWDRHDLDEQAIEELSWTARDFVLVRSYHGLGKHEVLGRWPLQTTV